jgi:hypothetical protein
MKMNLWIATSIASFISLFYITIPHLGYNFSVWAFNNSILWTGVCIFQVGALSIKKLRKNECNK